MEDKIQQLINETGADRVTAEMILNFTGGDIDGARKIFESMPKDYLALKIRYMGHKTHNYGVILVVMNIKERIIEEIELTVSNEMKASEIDTNLKYEIFKEAIRDFIKKGNVNLIMIDRLKEDISSEEFKSSLFKHLTKDGVLNTNDVRIIFSELLFKVLTEPNAAVKLDTEKIDVFRYTRKERKEPMVKEEKPEKEEREVKPKREEVEIRSISLVLLKIEPVLSPVKGMPVSELQPGDEIMVRIIDERDIGDYLAGLLGGKQGENRIPISATIKEIEKSPETENIMILVQFGPGIAGRCFVPAGIKIETPIGDELAELKKLSGFSISPIWIVVLLIILIVIFIIITILSKGEY